MYDILFQPITKLISIKETAEKALKRLDIKNVRDLLFYKPNFYQIIDNSSDLSNLVQNKLIHAEVTIQNISPPTSPRAPMKIQTSNDTGRLNLLFFNKIPPYIFNRLSVGKKIAIAGKINIFDDRAQITHPEFIFKKELIVPVEPVYPLTYGIINRQLYDYIVTIFNLVNTDLNLKISVNKVPELEKEYIINILNQIKILHAIGLESDGKLVEEKTKSVHTELSYQELLSNQIALLQLKRKEQNNLGRKFAINHELKEQVLQKLGFTLTNAQKQVIKEIESDQNSNIQMVKLLQGDVGSGKTLVALMTIINILVSKSQAVLMAPTDLLSIQHYNFFCKAFEELEININIALLTGKTTKKERKIIDEGLKNGDIQILIGTHALFQENVQFKELSYVIIDEQHRFGVQQRAQLINKATHPDILVMTATPIPRSLTLTMFGDMSLSSLKSKPKDRLPIITKVMPVNKNKELMSSLQKKLDTGEKIYWVCPLIDQNDKSLEKDDRFSFADVETRFSNLNELYPGKVAILHGKMKSAEKDSIMQDFKEGNIRILVSTTVIEVGIDVPDATLMIIENAEKFGLAQLHQLRGRVGRGSLQSYCILLYNPHKLTEIGNKRLEIMRNSNDGFYIAEQDLILRGSGDILGTKQSGEPIFFFANLTDYTSLLIEANEEAQKITNSSGYPSSLIGIKVKLFQRN